MDDALRLAPGREGSPELGTVVRNAGSEISVLLRDVIQLPCHAGCAALSEWGKHWVSRVSVDYDKVVLLLALKQV